MKSNKVKNAKKINKQYEDISSSMKNCIKYIERHDDYLPDDLCEYLIEKFEELKEKGFGYKGRTAGVKRIGDKLYSSSKSNLESKNSYDIYMQPVFSKIFDDWKEKETLLNKYIQVIVCNYIVSHGLAGVENIGGGLLEYMKENELNNIQKTFNYQNYCIRKYDRYVGQFKSLHSDVGMSTVRRVCAVLIYLNDVEEGGETIFPVLGEKVTPKKGRVVIFPSYFTHYHYASIPMSSDKYVICIHINYNNTDKLENNNEKEKK